MIGSCVQTLTGWQLLGILSAVLITVTLIIVVALVTDRRHR